MGFHGLNVWAVLAAAVSAFVLGGLWYAPFLFGKAWKGANGFGSEEPLTAGAKVFVISFVLSLIIGVNLAISEDGRARRLDFFRDLAGSRWELGSCRDLSGGLGAMC